MGEAPLTFRCTKCKVLRDRYDHHKGTNLIATGKTRRRKQSGRYNVPQAEYKCRACGHVGWSSHTSIIIKARQA